MREIGLLEDEGQANLFRDFLYNEGLESDVEPSSGGGFRIWIHDEARLEEAESLLADFKADPANPLYTSGAEGAGRKREEAAKQDRAYARMQKTRDDIAGIFGSARSGRVTMVLLAISVVITLLCGFGGNEAVVQKLAIAESFSFRGDTVYYTHLAEVRRGEVWRLVTPIFMHFNIIHILFNMMWLLDLGGMMERIRGPRFLLLFVLAAAVVPNVAQYYVSGPGFGGMSGVVYALLGFVWMQAKFNPWSSFVLHPITVQMMLIWLVLGFTGLLGGIANVVHLAGLLTGVAWGYLDARRAG